MKIKKIYQGSLPENKILNSRSTSQTDTYSCDYLNNLELTSEITFTKNEADNIYYYNIYATKNEVQISADIRYNFAKNTRIKVLTIEKGYEALISNTDKTLRFPISTDATGVTGYADVNSKGEVYITTLGTATATYINIRYRYK